MSRQLFFRSLVAVVIVAILRGEVTAQTCTGDCDRDRNVVVSEIITCINIALGTLDVDSCRRCDSSDDGQSTVDEILLSVNIALGNDAVETIAGTCLRPGSGNSSLTPCPRTSIRVLRCERSDCADPPAPTLVAEPETDNAGSFSADVHGCQIADERLLFEADVEPPAEIYRTLVIGKPKSENSARGTGGALENVTIGPMSEAAVQLLFNLGLDKVSDESIAAIVQAVEAANADTNFVGLGSREASALALSVANSDPGVQQAVTESQYTPTPTKTHTRTAIPTPTATAPAPSALVGTWFAGDPRDENGSLGVLVFFDQAHYMIIEQASDDNDVLDGFEWGAYTWNPTTHAFPTPTVFVNNDGEGGFSDLRGPSRIDVDRDHLSFFEAGIELATATRLTAETSNPLLGTWRVGNPADSNSDLIVVTFLDDSHFVFAENGPDDDPDGQDGIERGTYTWNPNTKAFKPTVGPDTNRNWGFSDVRDVSIEVIDAGTSLKVTIPGDGVIIATRVTP